MRQLWGCLESITVGNHLEYQSGTQYNSPVTTVSSPLIQEIRSVYSSFRNAEVSVIEDVEYISSQLEPNVFAESGVLDHAEIDVEEVLSPNDVPASVTDPLRGRNAREEIRTSIHG